mmetsp:Transcript_4725/g.10220  ORF Transcript_4725/g.10220 Transcript_4725/m.10220 type:complete len:389 (+) Transcript_4725:200-1366(+)|eukprot:CAMPEP_0202902752 /NCGR_PEP_ID=MMETSP1392-20130828/17031_1 /ASSEMBLY_ACC=CAM_ASM_000868 /TAXON_ID=225041 /ORGANISM="Chlamydomonas chlamydogama, Strain SAG 11-48b" /LENGTH=388 /DNA_ID=CAMNT_0049589559 /DNA_START=151 /DNA_END=1317 /DNA_ORIENTATION=-
MGNSPSSSRPSQPIPPGNPPSQQTYQYPVTTQYTQPHQVTGGYYQQQPGGYNNGQYYGNYNSPYMPYQPGPPGHAPAYQAPYMPGQYGQPPRPQVQVPVQEYQTTSTIRNQVNLKKPTLKITASPGNSQELSVSFRFDASAACRATVFFLAKELKGNCKIQSTSQAVSPAVYYEKGLDHNYPMEGHNAPVLKTQFLSPKHLTTATEEEYPIIVRLEALTDEGREQRMSLRSLEPGCELPSWVQAQTTYARLQREEDGSWGLRVIKQKIWVKGSTYELQEIYGMEQGHPAEVVDGYDDLEGNDCVICMSAARDTTALPCRHMCMCHTCATALKTQTNKCPICRNTIESLLHIKINGKQNARISGTGQAETTAAGASSAAAGSSTAAVKR